MTLPGDDSPTRDLPPQAHSSGHVDRIGPYRVTRLLGAGGMGIVYEAVQENPPRPIAIKVLRRGLSRSATRRFHREARLLASLRHPGLCEVYEAGESEDGLPYIAMELIEGAQPITSACLSKPLRDRVALIAQATRAVQAAHAQRVIHRDLKPDNILVDNAGRARVIDLGVARILAQPGATATRTVDGAVVGTLGYMSPEQLRGQPVDARSDVYSLGAVLYELAEGKPMLDPGEELAQATRRLLEQLPKPPSTDPRLGAIITAATRTCPADRYPDAGAMADDLDRWLEGKPIAAAARGTFLRIVDHARWWYARVPLLRLIISTAIALLAAGPVGVPVSSSLDAPQRWQQFMLAERPSDERSSLEGVFVVLYDDADDLTALGRELGLSIEPSEPTSQRPLAGRLFSLLADAKPAAVVFDRYISRPASNPAWDAAFLEGVRRLRRDGIGYVQAAFPWPISSSAVPYPDQFAAERIRWGGITIQTPQHSPWSVDLFAMDPAGEPMPGLAVQSMAAIAGPEARASIRVDEPGMSMSLAVVADRSNLGVSTPLVPPRTYVLSDLQTRATEGGLRADVLVGTLLVVPPDQTERARASMTMSEVFAAARAGTLSQHVAGKIVIIGDARTSAADLSAFQDETIARVFGHAAAISALHTGRVPRLPPEGWRTIAMLTLGSLAMSIALSYCSPRLRWQVVAIAGCAVFALVLCVLAYHAWSVLMQPVPWILVVLMSGGATLILRERVPRPR